MPWFLIICVSLIGAVADVMIGYWSNTYRLEWWLAGAVGYLVFMTGLGFIIREGMTIGFPLTVALVLVLLINVAFVAMWDMFSGASPSTLQWVGVVLALAAATCLELGRN